MLSAGNVDDGAIELLDFRTYLKVKDGRQEFNFITSFIMNHVRPNAVRTIVPIKDALAQRNIYLAYMPDRKKKLISLLNFLDENMTRVMSGNTFLPYYLFPEDASNLRIIDRITNGS